MKVVERRMMEEEQHTTGTGCLHLLHNDCGQGQGEVQQLVSLVRVWTQLSAKCWSKKVDFPHIRGQTFTVTPTKFLVQQTESHPNFDAVPTARSVKLAKKEKHRVDAVAGRRF